MRRYTALLALLMAACFVQPEPRPVQTRCGSTWCEAPERCISYDRPPFNECAAACEPETACPDGCACLALSDGTGACGNACIAWRACLESCETLDLPWGCQPAVPMSCDASYAHLACQLRCDERFHCARCGKATDRCAAAGYERCPCPEEHGGFPCHHRASFGECRRSAVLAQLLAAHVPPGSAAVAARRDPDGGVQLAATGEAGGLPVAPDAQFRIASLTKSFTAALVLLLADDGLLSLDDPAASHGVAIDPGITIRDLLRHETELGDYLLALQATGGVDVPHTPAELVAIGVTAPRRPDGYSNTNYIALGMIIEEVTGHSYGAALASRLLTPLGLTRTSLEGYLVGAAPVPGVENVAVHPSNVWAAGGVVSTAEDLVTWIDALLLRRTVLSAGASSELATVGARGFACGWRPHGAPTSGRLWHDGSDPRGAATWMGADRPAGRAAVVLTNSLGAGSAVASVGPAALGW